MPDAVANLQNSGRDHTQDQHGGGGRIGCFQISIDQDGSVIDHTHFKEHIYSRHKDVKPTKDKNAEINAEDMFTLYPLNQT